MWTIFKVFIEFVIILPLFYVLVFWLKGMCNLTSLTEPERSALEGEVVTIWPSGAPLYSHLMDEQTGAPSI